MNNVGISKSILSVSSPGTHLKSGDHKLAAQITRETNIEVSTICSKNPDRFGFFASLPVPAVEESIAEIDYALDTLGACGFVLMTNAHSVYLGDPEMEPIFAKLNERRAIIFIHPTQCHTADHPTDDKPLAQYPTPMLEYFFDTTRAVTNLLLSGTVTRYAHLTFIVSHSGAVLPPLIERLTSFSSMILSDNQTTLNGDQVKLLFRTRFYFDLAGFPFPDQIHGYLRICDHSRLLYGSDYPYTPAPAVLELAKRMDKGLRELFGDDRIQGIYSGHAHELFQMRKV